MINIQPIERGGKYFVEIVMVGQPIEPRGPLSDEDEALALAHQLAGWCRVMHSEVCVRAPSERKRRYG